MLRPAVLGLTRCEILHWPWGEALMSRVDGLRYGRARTDQLRNSPPVVTGTERGCTLLRREAHDTCTRTVHELALYRNYTN
jgi:hypothetical protein